MFQDINLEEVLDLHQQQQMKLIDVRSPSEFENGSIPGSINIPIFTDKERAEVGTLYTQVSVQAAKDRGLEIFSDKLPTFIEKFKQIEGPKAVYCWRGGMRSKTAATVIDLMGISVSRLIGGVRSYRKWVVDSLDSFEMKPNVYALNGYTGAGKTIILNELIKKGLPAIDLEGRAQHRGSIFGQIGLNPNNQKTFDSLLLDDLIQLQDSPFTITEAESKRVGKVTVPDFLLRKMEQGTEIFIDMPIEERVRNILTEYQPWNYPEEFLRAFKLIKKRIHTPIATQIEKDLLAENYSSAVQLLLEYYYDPRYEHSREQYPSDRSYTIQVKDVDDAITSISEFLTAQHAVNTGS
ncbi:tRNA 2-selenouridine(34) synthase MnmH [Halobacillus seohaensis]|uniref:tRNA 2-selenouridine(34) synthase MnmH n=1 Tax=Halobacillus seohaensis TaxID=447421 RepID=A0ABW2EPG4_9BACI